VDTGDIVGLIIASAIAFFLLVLSYVVFKLARVVEETQRLVQGITQETVPLLGQVNTSVSHVNSELVRVESITANVQSMTGNLSSLTSLFAATLGGPVVKVAAFSYGVRRAAAKRDKAEVTKQVKAELKAAKRTR
jgi:uncharacterized protein YoxC